MTGEPTTGGSTGPDVDVAVVGAGLGGIYAVHRFERAGLSIAGFEGAPDVGGVWYHNRYPGSRVDVEGYYYCYFFDPELFAQWHWSERYPAQSEILAYLQFVADKYDVRRHFRFRTWVTQARWDPARQWYEVDTDSGESVTARFLVMATGQLSKARTPDFEGLDDFEGEWVQTSHWPEHQVELAGRRIGVIGTGASGVQTVTAVAAHAAHLYVFQRTANYSAPAHNGPVSREVHEAHVSHSAETWVRMLSDPGGVVFPFGTVPATECTPDEQLAQLEKQWAWGGQAMVRVFPDQGVNHESNTVVADFVRDKVRQIVRDPDVAEQLVPNRYPIGTRRMAVDTGYYETFNRDNVTLVDIRSDPIERITRHGIKTRYHHYDLDLIVFALGFTAFTGALDAANIVNEHGLRPTDSWRRGPQTYLGLMTRGFPNLFILTGAGSPSVLSNMFACNVFHADFVADLIDHMQAHGYSTVEPTADAQAQWSDHVQDLAAPLIRLNVDNYMVHVNRDDGTRVFIPYVGGLHRYVEEVDHIVKDGYPGFEFRTRPPDLS